MRLPTPAASLACAAALLLAAGAALAGPNGSTELRLSPRRANPPGCSDLAPFAGKPLIVAWGDYGAIVHGDGFDAFLESPPPLPRSARLSAFYRGKQKLGDSTLDLVLEIYEEGPELSISTDKPACQWHGRAKLT